MALVTCPSCGAPMSDNAAACPQCGAAAATVCAECGAKVSGNAKSCPNCGAPVVRSAQPGVPQQPYGYQQAPTYPTGKSKITAGILALFLGGLGIDLFYCGKTQMGIVVLVCGLFAGFVTAILALIRGIKMLCISQEMFERKWINVPNDMKVPII